MGSNYSNHRAVISQCCVCVQYYLYVLSEDIRLHFHSTQFIFRIPNSLSLALSLSLSLLIKSRLWSVLRIVTGMGTVSQEFATVSQDSWGLTALEVNTHIQTPATESQ